MKHLIGCASGGPPNLSAETGKKFHGVFIRRRLVGFYGSRRSSLH
jgi:hypothetical protein